MTLNTSLSSATALNQEENNSDDNKYHKLVKAFMNICDVLQEESNFKKKTVDFEAEVILSETRKTIENVKDVMQNISDTTNKVALSNIGLESHELIIEKESIELPYSMQSETVNCLKELFNSNTKEKYKLENPVQIPKMDIVAGIIKKIEINTNELENFQLMNSLD